MKMKLKTNKAIKKRFKRTKSGLFKRKRAGRRHLLTGKSRKGKRKLRRSTLTSHPDTATLRRMLPYG